MASCNEMRKTIIAELLQEEFILTINILTIISVRTFVRQILL